MATDAEITLKFTAEIQEALKAIRMLRDEIEKIKAAGGFLSPEDMELISEMKAKLDEYTRTVRELQIEYYRLQQRSGEMSAEFIAQTTNLRQQIIETQRQVSKLTEKYEKQGKVVESLKKRVKDLEDGHKRTEDNGIHAYRSLRTAVGHFIISLTKGKLAVKELGIALKGLAYSSVILGAIQLAMDGIMWAWKGIKSLFTESKEEMDAAEDAAKRAQKELDNAKREAERAAEEVRKLKEKLAEKKEAETLKETLKDITKEYETQRTAVEDTLAALKEQAQVKARERAAEAAQRTGELDMELLGLEERFVTGDIDKRNYVIQKADIEKRKRDETRVAAVDTAEIAKEAAEAERDIVQKELAASYRRINVLKRELTGKGIGQVLDYVARWIPNLTTRSSVTPDSADIEKAKLDKIGKMRSANLVELQNALDEFHDRFGYAGHYDSSSGNFEFENSRYANDIKLNGLIYEALQPIKEIEDRRRRLNERYRTQEKVANEATSSAKQYQQTAQRLDEERKTAAGLEKTAKTAEDSAQKANDALRDALAKTSREGGLDDRMTSKKLDIELIKIDKDEQTKSDKAAEKAAEKEAKAKEKAKQRRQEMNRLAADIAEQAQIAANTSKDTDDKAVLDKIRKAKEKYGAVFDKVLAQQNGIVSAVEMLQANTDRNERTLKELQGRIDKLVKQGKVQDTRSRKRSSL